MGSQAHKQTEGYLGINRGSLCCGTNRIHLPQRDSHYLHNGLSNRKLWLATMSLLMCLLSNFAYICCHKFRVPLGTAWEERSLLWQQSGRTVAAINADNKEAKVLSFSVVPELLLPPEILKTEPRAWTSS